MAMEIKKCWSNFMIFFKYNRWNFTENQRHNVKTNALSPRESTRVYSFFMKIFYLIEPSYNWCKCRAEEAHVKSSNPILNWIFIITNSHLVHYIELEIYELTRCKVPQFFSAQNFGPLVKNLNTNNTDWENHLIWTQQPMTCQNLRRNLLKTYLRQFNDSCT